MKYDKARSNILDGDLIAVVDVPSLYARATRFFTRSPYSHVGVALWLDEGLWLVELNAGSNHAKPLSQIPEFDVYNCPVNRAAVRKAALESLRINVPYSWLTVVVSGALDFFHLPKPRNWDHGLVCSSYCIELYEAAGWPSESETLSPGDLCDLLTRALNVRQ